MRPLPLRWVKPYYDDPTDIRCAILVLCALCAFVVNFCSPGEQGQLALVRPCLMSGRSIVPGWHWYNARLIEIAPVAGENRYRYLCVVV